MSSSGWSTTSGFRLACFDHLDEHPGQRRAISYVGGTGGQWGAGVAGLFNAVVTRRGQLGANIHPRSLRLHDPERVRSLQRYCVGLGCRLSRSIARDTPLLRSIASTTIAGVDLQSAASSPCSNRRTLLLDHQVRRSADEGDSVVALLPNA